jgi:hypothetical protein
MTAKNHLAIAAALSVAVAAAVQLTSCSSKPPQLQFLPGFGNEPEIRRAESTDESALFPAPTELNIPAGAVELNDEARFLAGLPALGAKSTMGSLRASAAWQKHKSQLDQMWRDFEVRHAAPVSSWASSHISDLRSARAVLYPFSGPDFVFANLFYPKAETYVLCGLEPCEPLPTWTSLSGQDVEGGLAGLTNSLSNILQFSYFITKDMRQDFQATRFRGVLPVFLVFLTRTGHVVESVDAVRLDGNGSPNVSPTGQSSVSGLLIRARGPQGPKRIFYFSQDLADGALSTNAPLLKFATSLGRPAVLLKSASYLMHESYFSHIRNHLLTNTCGIVEDPSGVPWRSFMERNWRMSLYGNYQNTIPIFKQYEQPDLATAYLDRSYGATPLPFSIGYLLDPATTSLIVGRPR